MFVNDDPRQAEFVRRFLQELTPEDPGFVSTVVIVELAWVLEDTYGLRPADIRPLIRGLLESSEIVVENAEAVEAAVASSHRDLADMLIHFIGAGAGCERTVTFDRTFARIDGVGLLRR
ncbi:MAG: PIN domain-containing protein [Gammaproteobacteria bacterium]|nr:PIN domain-containing protein [Gammaproteobacteria bacterium]